MRETECAFAPSFSIAIGILMRFLTPVLIVIYIAWILSALFYFGETARWLFGSNAWWVSFVAWPLALVVCWIPLGFFAVCGVIFYYLAFVQDWNILAAAAYLFPGLAFAAAMLLADGIGEVFAWLRNR